MEVPLFLCITSSRITVKEYLKSLLHRILHGTPWEYSQCISDYVPLASEAPGFPKTISKGCLSAEQNPCSHWSATNCIKWSATREQKNWKSLHSPAAVAVWHEPGPFVRHTFEFVVFWVRWEERVWKKFGESEASVLGSVLNVVPYCRLQLLHEFWTGCSQLLNNFIPLINIWTPVVKGNKRQTPV